MKLGGVMLGGTHSVTMLLTVELEMFNDNMDIMMHDITIDTVNIQ